MPGFVCPFCGNGMSLHGGTERTFLLNSSGCVKLDPVSAFKTPYLELTIFSCPNESCGMESVFIKGRNGYMNNEGRFVYPKNIFRRFPDFVPKAIREDYEEASKIIDGSPKAAATLCRRCLQGMIRDFWGIKKGSLAEEINELQGKIPSAQWYAIDALRKIGNIGAHMEKDVNVIIDIEEDEAQMLLQLIELLIEKWYINRHDEEELYQKISETSLTKKKH